jgi:hypothetical protein
MVRYCPAGDGEFEDWVETCPVCGEPLEDLADEDEEPPQELERVDEPIAFLATAPNEPVADMWVEALQQQGIRAMARPLGPGFGGWASAFNLEHALYVLESRLAEAREVIKAFEGSGFDDQAESPFRGRRR